MQQKNCKRGEIIEIERDGGRDLIEIVEVKCKVEPSKAFVLRV